MGHLGAHVDGSGFRLECVQILGETLPGPVHAFCQGGPRNILDTFHQFDQKVVRVGPHRGETDPAVAHHNRRDTVPTGRRKQRIPGRLAIVVGVNVDPTGRDDRTGGVDLARCLAADLAGRRDSTVADRQVTLKRVFTSPVDEGPIADDQIVHCPFFPALESR